MDAEKKSEFLKDIGQQIKTARENLGITAVELAKRTGTERSTIARIETGRTNPTASTLKSIADALGISFVELFDGFNH